MSEKEYYKNLYKEMKSVVDKLKGTEKSNYQRILNEIQAASNNPIMARAKRSYFEAQLKKAKKAVTSSSSSNSSSSRYNNNSSNDTADDLAIAERNYYEKLLKEMKNTVNNLNLAKSEIDSLIYKLNQGLSIDDVGYETDELTDMKQKIEEYCNKLNTSIIPAIKNKIEEL